MFIAGTMLLVATLIWGPVGFIGTLILFLFLFLVGDDLF